MTVQQRIDELDDQFRMAVALDTSLAKRSMGQRTPRTTAASADAYRSAKPEFSESEKRKTELTRAEIQAAVGRMNAEEKSFLRKLVDVSPREAEVFVEIYHYFPGVRMEE